MDPNACIQRILDALPGNVVDFLEACEDLADWLANGGFVPSRINEVTDKHLLLLGIYRNTEVRDTLFNAREMARTAEKGRGSNG